MTGQAGAALYVSRPQASSLGMNPAGLSSQEMESAVVTHVDGLVAHHRFQRNVIIGLALTTLLSLASNYGSALTNGWRSGADPLPSLIPGRQQPSSKCNITASVVPVMVDNPAIAAQLKTITHDWNICSQALTACQSQHSQFSQKNTDIQQILDSVRGNLDTCNSQKANLATSIPAYQKLSHAAETDLADCLASLEACANGVAVQKQG